MTTARLPAARLSWVRCSSISTSSTYSCSCCALWAIAARRRQQDCNARPGSCSGVCFLIASAMHDRHRSTATRADIPAITRIYAHSVEHGTASFELSAPEEAEMARRLIELTAYGFTYLV